METKYTWAAANFTGSQSLQIEAKDWTADQLGEKHVVLLQREGSMNFQFNMTPTQARQMAMALIAAAESLA